MAGQQAIWTSGVSTVLILLLVTCLQRSAAQRSSDWSFTIQEEQPRGTFVGNVKEKAGLDTQYPSDISNHLQFQFLTPPRANLLIENNTGIIRIGGLIDRDQICALKRLCKVSLDIAVRPVEYFQIIKISVQIEDINDNWPHFPVSEKTHQMLESTSPGSSFIIPAARDPDGPRYGIKEYRLVPDSSTFRLQQKNKLDGSTEVRLVLRNHLDRESQFKRYLFRIIAYDGDDPPKTGSLDLDIIIVDVNDNSPVFDNSSYAVTVLENMDPRSTVVQVHATDPDIGTNSKVRYGFSQHTNKTYGDIFGIDNATGEIFVRASLDHERSSLYHLVVTAQDGGQDALTADATVIIRVQDINDNAPEISVNTLMALGTDIAEIPENVPIGTFVAHISVVDQDSGLNGEVSCALHDKHFQLRPIEAERGKFQILTAKALDRELMPEFNLALVCRDRGRPSRTSTKGIQVKVTDINDNNPIFDREIYRVEIRENNAKGDTIVRVNATDADIGKNGQIRYMLPEAWRKRFRIDPDNGVIFANEEMDREREGEGTIKFPVMAEDRGSPPGYDAARVFIKLKDLNDEPPRFLNNSYSFSVLENGKEGIEVGVVTARDADTFPNNQFTYSFRVPNNYARKFALNKDTGQITTLRSLDREVQTVYDIVVIAKDSNNPSLSSTVVARVFIKDQNDNAPVFSYPTKENSTLHISNKVPVGKSIGRVHASDADYGQSANVTYYLMKGNDGNSFIFDSRRGDIRLKVDLSHVKSRVYDLEIEARDHGSPQQTSKVTLKIIVNDTIVYYVAEARTSILSGTNFVIIIIVSSISFVVIVLLVAAIVMVVVKQRRDRHKHTTYANNMESMQMLHGRDTMSTFTDGLSPKHHNPPGSPSSSCSEHLADVTMEIDDSEMEGSPKRWGRPPWPSAPDANEGQTVVTEMLESPGGCPQRSSSNFINHGATRPNMADDVADRRLALTPPGLQRPWVFPQQQRHLEVQQVLHVSLDNDVDSNQSGDVSNADSGRGASEEGDPLTRGGDVCPKCHSTIPRGGQMHNSVCPAHGAPHTLPHPPKNKAASSKPPICCPSRFTTFSAGATPLSNTGSPPSQSLSKPPRCSKPPRSMYSTIREQDPTSQQQQQQQQQHSYNNGFPSDSTSSRTFPRGQQQQQQQQQQQHMAMQTFGNHSNLGHHSNDGGQPHTRTGSRPGAISSSRSVIV